MSWGMIGGAAVTAVGGYFSSKDSGSSRPETPRWITGRQQDLAGRYDELLERPSLSPEERVAAYTDEERQAIEQLGMFGQEGGLGHDLLQGVLGADPTGAYQEGMQGMRDVIGEGAVQVGDIDMDYVRSLIDNDVLQGQMDAIGRDIERNFAERDAPMSRLHQALSGGTGSTRGAIGDALLQARAQEDLMDVGGEVRGRAFRDALGYGHEQVTQQADIDRLNQVLRLGGAGNLMQAGMGGMGLARGMGLGNIDTTMKAGGMDRAYEQALRDVEYENWQRMYGDLEAAGGFYEGLGPQHTGTSYERESSPNPLALGLEAAGAIWGRPGAGGGAGGGGDPFDFSEGGFFRPASDFLKPEDFGNFGIDMDWLQTMGGGT